MGKLRVAVIGATGYVGQRFLTLLDKHPFFEVKTLVASERSQGKTYSEAMKGRWKLDIPMPSQYSDIRIQSSSDVKAFCKDIDLAFCAVDMKKEEIIFLEEAIAREEVVVVSNNSANRLTDDVPIVIPEINHGHFAVLEAQKERLGTKKGFIVAKPNCSVQSFVPALFPLLDYGLDSIMVSTYQAVSGAGKTLEEWPEMLGNVIPNISGEEEKTETEPLKILGSVSDGKIVNLSGTRISSQCARVPVQEGHLANVWVKFRQKPSRDEILKRWAECVPLPQELKLPLAPQPFLHYFEEIDRPQSRLDAGQEKGMGITLGRLQEDGIFDFTFTCLSANTIRGAAGGAVLTAELLYKLGYINQDE